MFHKYLLKIPFRQTFIQKGKGGPPRVLRSALDKGMNTAPQSWPSHVSACPHGPSPALHSQGFPPLGFGIPEAKA